MVPAEGNAVGLIQKNKLKFVGAALKESFLKQDLLAENWKLPPPSEEFQEGNVVLHVPPPAVKSLPALLRSVQVDPVPE